MTKCLLGCILVHVRFTRLVEKDFVQATSGLLKYTGDAYMCSIAYPGWYDICLSRI
jgi:hypothetical protein